jgi:hypothetical protein
MAYNRKFPSTLERRHELVKLTVFPYLGPAPCCFHMLWLSTCGMAMRISLRYFAACSCTLRVKNDLLPVAASKVRTSSKACMFSSTSSVYFLRSLTIESLRVRAMFVDLVGVCELLIVFILHVVACRKFWERKIILDGNIQC